MEHVYLIGHRGASGNAPENTVASFDLALEIGVDAIELDVHQTKDKQVTVIHDETVDRTTNGKGFVSSLSYDQIKEKNYSFSAGQYFDIKIEYVDITSEEFEEKINFYKKNLTNLFVESKELEEKINRHLNGLSYE